MSFNLSSINFKAGNTSREKGLRVKTPNVTIIVGPNNSGKTRVLEEIDSAWRGDLEHQKEFVVIDGVDINIPNSKTELEEFFKLYKSNPPKGHSLQKDSFWVIRPQIRPGEREFQESIPKEWFSENFEIQKEVLTEKILRLTTLRLDGETRFSFVQAKESGDLNDSPKNILQILFSDVKNYEKVRNFTEAAFRQHYVIDPTDMKHLVPKMSEEKPTQEIINRSLDSNTLDFFKKTKPFSSFGAGIRASVGLVSAVVALEQKILLIDEPEAFLHPNLSNLLGRFLAKIAEERNASLVVATHSSNFLMGCIQSNVPVKIIRVTYLNGSATTRCLETEEVSKLATRPLLRSANTLNALFARGVIVTESDADRALYEEINYRLLSEGLGIDEAVFLNAQNWQTTCEIVRPLRSLGIPACAVLDFDVLFEPKLKKVWEMIVQKDKVDLSRLQKKRNDIKELLLERYNKDDLKTKGVTCISSQEDRKKVQEILEEMCLCGIFIVPCGELESWLPTLGASGKKGNRGWIVNIFELLEEKNPSSTDNDIWGFLKDIKRWIDDPNRKM